MDWIPPSSLTNYRAQRRPNAKQDIAIDDNMREVGMDEFYNVLDRYKNGEFGNVVPKQLMAAAEASYIGLKPEDLDFQNYMYHTKTMWGDPYKVDGIHDKNIKAYYSLSDEDREMYDTFVRNIYANNYNEQQSADIRKWMNDKGFDTDKYIYESPEMIESRLSAVEEAERKRREDREFEEGVSNRSNAEKMWELFQETPVYRYGKPIVQMIDPTGITGYGDLVESYNEYKDGDGSFGNLALNAIGALPVMGKIKTGIRLGKNGQRIANSLNAVNDVIDTPQELIGSGLKNIGLNNIGNAINKATSVVQDLTAKPFDKILTNPEARFWYNNAANTVNILEGVEDAIDLAEPVVEDVKKLSNGGSLHWNNLSIGDRSRLMKLYLSNGIKDINAMKEHYNSFAEGGDTKNPRFVERLLEGKNRKTIPNWENPENVATHKLSYVTFDDGSADVYPNVQEIDGELVDFTTQTKYGPVDPYNMAKQNNNILHFDAEDQARDFTENYKTRPIYAWAGTFAEGGLMDLLDTPKDNGNGTWTVDRRETLSGIASQLGMPVKQLQDLNGISDPNMIRVGQILRYSPNAQAQQRPVVANATQPRTYVNANTRNAFVTNGGLYRNSNWTNDMYNNLYNKMVNDSDVKFTPEAISYLIGDESSYDKYAYRKGSAFVGPLQMSVDWFEKMYPGKGKQVWQQYVDKKRSDADIAEDMYRYVKIMSGRIPADKAGHTYGRFKVNQYAPNASLDSVIDKAVWNNNVRYEIENGILKGNANLKLGKSTYRDLMAAYDEAIKNRRY